MTAPINLYRGDSPPVAQVTKIAPANPVAGDTFTLACNGKSITITAPDNTLAGVVNALATGVQNSTIPEFSEMLASPSVDGTYLTLTAVSAGTPFQVTCSTTAIGSVSIVETTPGKNGVNEVHKISLVGTYTGGTFTITYSFGTTAAIAYNATAATVQAAIAALPGVGAGQVLVTGGPGPNSPWFVEWTGTLGAQSIAVGTINGASLTGNGSVTVTETTRGNGLSDDVQFLDCTPVNGQVGISFTLTLDGQTTSVLTSASTAAAIQTALQALPNVGSGNCLVLGAALQNGEPTTYVIHFTGALAGTHVSTLVVGGYVNPGYGSAPTVTKIQNGGQTTSDDIQWIDLGFTATGAGTGGTVANFTATIGGQTTVSVQNNTVAAGGLQTALQNLSGIGANNCLVYGPSQTGMTSQVVNGLLVRFTGAKANTAMGNITVAVSSGPGATVTRQSFGAANVNEVQSVVIFGTGGTFTLSLGGQTTAATAWNASAATVQANIIAAFTNSLTAVTVSGAGTLASPYVVTFTNPSHTPFALMTGSGASLTGGGGTIVEQTAGAAGVNEVQTATLIAGVTGGTFTLAFNGAATSPLAWNASAATVQTALVALATINTVTVAGSAGGPYTITWSGAQGSAPQNLLVGNGSGLTGQTGNQTLTPSTLTFSSGPQHFNDPLNWSLARVPNSGDALSFEQGSSNCAFGINQMATFVWVSSSTLQLTGTTWFDFQNGQSVYLTTTTTLPTGLAVNTLYYVIGINRDAGTFGLAATLGGAAIVVSGAGAGTHTLGVRLASLEDNSRWTGNLGLPQANPSGYVEYRPQYLHIGYATVAQGGAACVQSATIGTGQGTGSGLCQMDSDVDQVAVTVITTGSSAQPGIPAVLWKGQHPANTLAVFAGSVGVALFPNETAVLGATSPTNALTGRGGSIELGPGVTVTGPVSVTGGTLLSDGATINGPVLLR